MVADKQFVEVLYAYPDRYFLQKVEIIEPLTVEQVIIKSQILEKYPEIDLKKNKIGIFSRSVKLTEFVEQGDRIEIYRPLLADPKEIRRKRALQQDQNKA